MDDRPIPASASACPSGPEETLPSSQTTGRRGARWSRARWGAVILRWLHILALVACGGLAGGAVLSLRIPLPDWVGTNWGRLITGPLGFPLSVAFWGVTLSGGALRTSFSWRNHRCDYPSIAIAVELVAAVGVAGALRACWRTVFPGIDDCGLAGNPLPLLASACPVILPFLALVLGCSLRDGCAWVAGTCFPEGEVTDNEPVLAFMQSLT